MNGGVTAGIGRKKPGRFLLLAAGLLGASVIALGACFVLELLMEAAPVEIPPGLESGMVRCPPPPGAGADVPERGFWIDRFEVTVSEYGEFLRETGRSPPERRSPPYAPYTGIGHLPATYMTLHEARAFAAWRGKRLPTSAEWDWAARGPAGFRYPWGERFIETFANTTWLAGLRERYEPTIVGTFFNDQSFCGAYDMVGNVAEWTETQTTDRFGGKWVVRGGSFLTEGEKAMDAPEDTDDWLARPLGRAESDWIRANDIGFRCVADVAAAERDAALRAALGMLGARDPLQTFFRVRPAMAELAAGGEAARRLLVSALAINSHPTVRRRIEELLARLP